MYVGGASAADSHVVIYPNVVLTKNSWELYSVDFSSVGDGGEPRGSVRQQDILVSHSSKVVGSILTFMGSPGFIWPDYYLP